jgi:hypothetical protein
MGSALRSSHQAPLHRNMIQPDEIRRKATNLYPAFLRAWLEDKPFFPKTIPCGKRPDENLAIAAASVQRLREESKSVRGYGYSVQWTEVNSRTYGKNLFPTRITLETEADFLQYLGKQREFAAFTKAAGKIRSRYPELESWIRSHVQLLIESADDVEGLLRVVDCLRARSRPGVFARELPVGLDTKFVERNRRILREWLDQVLPPQTIRADEEHFERRFGLRYQEPHIMLRFLDPEAQRASGCPWPQFSLPLHTVAELVVDVARVLIVENKVNLLTLPSLPRTLVLGGLGNSVTDLRQVSWLGSCTLWYWGDIDVEGLTILSRLRSVFPQTRSLLMDGKTLSRWRGSLAVSGNGRELGMPPGLTEGERAAYIMCAGQNLRLEQERFPQSFIDEFFQKVDMWSGPSD